MRFELKSFFDFVTLLVFIEVCRGAFGSHSSFVFYSLPSVTRQRLKCTELYVFSYLFCSLGMEATLGFCSIMVE